MKCPLAMCLVRWVESAIMRFSIWFMMCAKAWFKAARFNLLFAYFFQPLKQFSTGLETLDFAVYLSTCHAMVVVGRFRG